MATNKVDDRFDGLFTSVAQATDGIEPLLDLFFSFLQRKTDFFTSNIPSESLGTPTDTAVVAKQLVLKYFDKHAALSAQKKAEIDARNRELDQKRRQREEEKRAAETAAQAARTSTSNSRVVDVTDGPHAPVNPSTPILPPSPSAESASTSTTSETKKARGGAGGENEDRDKPPPVGNGGSNDRYTWAQTLSALDVLVPVPPGTKSNKCDVVITPSRVKVGLKGETPLMDGEWHNRVKPDDSFWALVDGNTIQLNIEKHDQMKWWSCVVKGDEQIDTTTIVPENSKLSDLDPETRVTVEKMMFDQHQKQLGKPTSDQQKQADMLEQFKKQHPNLDFSKATINYGGRGGGSAM